MAGIKGHPALLGIFASRIKGLEKRDGSYWSLCPIHKEKTPSFNISLKDGEWVCYCFGCGWGSDVIGFVEKFDGVSFSKAVKIVEAITEGTWEETKEKSDAVFQKLDSAKAEEVPTEKYVKFELSLYESKEAQEWLFRERGITYDAARRAHFGFSQTLDSITTRYDKEKVGDLSGKGWITFAAIEGDKVLCIEARSIVEKVTRIRTGMTNQVLFGVDGISIDSPLFVTEGKFDSCILQQAGYTAVSLPNASTNLTPGMRDYLMQAPVRFLAGDNDNGAGSAKMVKLHSELQESTYMIKWPQGCKDANEVFLKLAGRDISTFRNIVDGLVLEAYSNPMPGIRSIQEILKNNESDNSETREDRFRFSIKSLDSMANILPGSVVYLTANSTGAGKSQVLLQETLRTALKHGITVLNYQTQMQGEEIGEIVTANILARDRGEITKEDRQEAAKRLKNCQYYIGHDPNAGGAAAALDLIEAGIRRVGANVVVIDLFHDICSAESDEVRAQAKAMRRFKLMMQKYLAIGIAIGQPRKIDPKNQNQDKPLTIYDLAKGSEAIISESDVVFYMHRKINKNITEDTSDRLSPEIDFYRMKGRNQGKGGALAKLFFLGKIATFVDSNTLREPEVKESFDF